MMPVSTYGVALRKMINFRIGNTIDCNHICKSIHKYIQNYLKNHRNNDDLILSIQIKQVTDGKMVDNILNIEQKSP